MWDYDYNALGQVTQVSIPNGMTTAYSYDGRNRMTKLEHKYGATVLDGYTYALDAAGEITRVTDQNSEYWDYAYDGRDRLTSAVRLAVPLIGGAHWGLRALADEVWE